MAVLAFGVAFALARSGDDPEPKTVRGVQPAAAAEPPPSIRTPASTGGLPPLPRKPKPKPQPQPSDEPADAAPAPSDTTPEPTFTPPTGGDGGDGGNGGDGGDGGGGGSTPPRRTDPPPDSDG